MAGLVTLGILTGRFRCADCDIRCSFTGGAAFRIVFAGAGGRSSPKWASSTKPRDRTSMLLRVTKPSCMDFRFCSCSWYLNKAECYAEALYLTSRDFKSKFRVKSWKFSTIFCFCITAAACKCFLSFLTISNWFFISRVRIRSSFNFFRRLLVGIESQHVHAIHRMRQKNFVKCYVLVLECLDSHLLFKVLLSLNSRKFVP